MGTPIGVLSRQMGAEPVAAAVPGRRAVAHWLFACCGMIFVMVVLGGVTRLTQSGLSITDWQPVIGIVPPLSHAAWLAEFDRYKLIPQYRVLNAGMSLTDFQHIFMWEYVHRLWGRLIGVVYFVPLVWFIARRQVPRRLVLPLGGVFLLGAAQGVLGWYMVQSGLAHRVEVSQYRLVAHLALALAIYAVTLWIALGLLRDSAPKFVMPGAMPGIHVDGRDTHGHDELGGTTARRAEAQARTWRRLAEALLALVALTICAGGFTAGLHAGLIDNTFPLMDGHFVPAGYARLQPLVRNWFANVEAVQFDHRLLAETTLIAVVALWIAGASAGLPRPAHLARHALLAAVLLQFSLGLSTLLFVVPIPLAAAHQAGAVLLLTAAIVFRHTLRRPILGAK
jgi:heme a synthase